MSRLIDADKLEESIKKYFKSHITDSSCMVYVVDCNADICRIVEEQPTAFDVEKIESALGKQIPRKPVEQGTDRKTHYKCECGYIMLTVYANGYHLGNQPKYCEKCGQKIDWSDEDE